MRVLPPLKRRGWADLLLCESFLAWPLYTVVLLALDRLNPLNSSSFLSNESQIVSNHFDSFDSLGLSQTHKSASHEQIKIF